MSSNAPGSVWISWSNTHRGLIPYARKSKGGSQFFINRDEAFEYIPATALAALQKENEKLLEKIKELEACVRR